MWQLKQYIYTKINGKILFRNQIPLIGNINNVMTDGGWARNIFGAIELLPEINVDNNL